MKKKLPTRSTKSFQNQKKKKKRRWLLPFGSGFAIVFAAFFLTRAQLPSQFSSQILPQNFCANSISCIHNLTASFENNAVGFFNGQIVTPPKIDLAMNANNSHVLGDTAPAGEKHIYVDLTNQILYAFQGNNLVMNTLISSGKWFPTPPGDYHIWEKIISTRMSGGSGADAYDLPGVPFVMFFSNDKVPASAGFSLHGAYWHDNFGHPMSHGCVNMREVDAEQLYNWADPQTMGSSTQATAENPGTTVSICSQVQTNNGAPPSCIE